MVTAVSEKINIDEINKVNVLTDRVKKRKDEFLAAKEHICAVRSRLVVESWKETEGETIAIRRAKLFKKIMEENDIAIRDGELIVGSQSKYVRGASPGVEYNSYVAFEIAASEKPKARGVVVEAILSEEDRKLLAEAAEFWKGRAPGEVSRKRVQEILGVDVDGLDEAHIVDWNTRFSPPARKADYEKVINHGLNGIIKEIREELEKLDPSVWEDYPKWEFLNAGITCCEAVINYAKRYAKLARELAEKESDEVRKRELEEIAERCEWVPANPARTFHEALQSFWLIHVARNLETAADGEVPGRMDQYLYPFYEKDIKEGRLTRQEAAELLGCLWVKLNEMLSVKTLVFRQQHQASHFQDTNICGVKADGTDATNELSVLILEVVRQMKMPQPPIYLRYHKDISDEVLIKAAETNRDYGGGSPAFVNDTVGILKLMDKGVPLAEARDWIVTACLAMDPNHASAIPTSPVSFHSTKAFELALHNGVDPKTGKQLGPATGDARNFKSYDEVYDAFMKQVKYFSEIANKGYGIVNRIHSELYCTPFASVLLDDCIKKGKSIENGGTRYLQFGPGWVDRGFQNIADSLTAMKKLVFEEKKVSMSELMDAIDANFEGKEDLRQMLLAAPKYGNDDDYADDAFNTVSMDITRLGHEYKDPWGYPITISRNGASGHWYVGMATGALPDGRKAWEAIGDAALSPVQGMDVKGPTAVILSASKVYHQEYGFSTVFNMKVTPSTLRTREGIRKFLALIKTYFDRGGWHIQFNAMGQEVLLDAKKHPEKHKDLLVRVAGYSAYFVELSEAVQDEIIARTEHTV